jgi:hypothetical protein
MRIISVILVSQGIVHSIQSFGIFEEQFSHDVIKKAEKLFELECRQLSDYITDDEMEEYIENGYFDSESNFMSVNLVWSDIE